MQNGILRFRTRRTHKAKHDINQEKTYINIKSEFKILQQIKIYLPLYRGCETNSK